MARDPLGADALADPHAASPARSDVTTGDLSYTGIANTPVEAVQAIDPKQDRGVAYRVLHDTAGESWNEAKHTLAAGKLSGPTSPEQSLSLQAMMRKLWEYRQWHHKEVLEVTKARVASETGDADGLKKWSAAGSESLTSDIDVNLKGTQTELAVKVFNEEFKKTGWSFEAGVVYDVNVYALDFMHGVGEQVGKDLLVNQEGARAGLAQGGFDFAGAQQLDTALQEEWALLKTRLYMTQAEWEDHKSAAGASGPERAKFARVEAKYEEYRGTLKAAMDREAGAVLAQADEAEVSGYQAIQDQATSRGASGAKAEDISIAASNRVYEEKLKDVASMRKVLRAKITTYDNFVTRPAAAKRLGISAEEIEALKLQISGILLELRERITECALYSNEAYLTHGAVNHGVVGLQIGQEVVMTKAAMFNAFQENMADALKEIGRHGESLGEAAYKSGKYIWRMADAIDNLGLDVEENRRLLNVGGYLANTVKNDDGIADKKGTSASMIESMLGVSDVPGLRGAILGVGMVTTAQYNEAVRSQGKSEDSAKAIDKDNWRT